MASPSLLIKNARVVQTGPEHPEEGEFLDILITDGKFSRIEASIPVDPTYEVIDAAGRIAFPGVVDAHQHWGIYNPLGEDAEIESRASVQGGVTTALSYMRTGQYYLNKGGAYGDVFPEVLEQTEGKPFVDYAYHLAPMSKEHIAEIPSLIEDHGVTSFKIFMFYGSHGLHGRSTDQSEFLMIPKDERYDIAHFEFVMRGIQKAREQLGRQGRPCLAVSALRDRRDHERLHQAGRGRGHAHGPGRVQRLTPAALGGPGGHHRVVPRRRDADCPTSTCST